MQQPEAREPMVLLLGQLRRLQYEVRPTGAGIFELTTPDGRLTLTVTETEFFREPHRCVANIRRALRSNGYPT
jgi:hypothetical protein